MIVAQALTQQANDKQQLIPMIERVREQVTAAMQPCSAIIQGVDDAWEVCLMKFTMELVQQSAGGNMGEFRKRGLI